MGVVVVERFKKESMYGLFAGTKKLLLLLHKGSKNQNGCETVTIKFLVMPRTFQDLKLIPRHPGERRKS